MRTMAVEWSRLCRCLLCFIIRLNIKSLRIFIISLSFLLSLCSSRSLQLVDTLFFLGGTGFRHINCGLHRLLHLPFQEAASASHLVVLFTSRFATFPFCSLIFVMHGVMMPHDILSLNWYFFVVSPQACCALGVCVPCPDTHVWCGYFRWWLSASCTPDVAGICLELPLIS